MVVFRRMIEGKNLTKTFPGHPVFTDVSFSIPDDAVTGLYGPSGIGKSTLVKILCGTLRPDAGEVLLDGTTLVSDRIPYDRKRGIVIQQVFQQPRDALDPWQRIGDGMRELIRYHHFASSREEAARLIRETLELAGLDAGILPRLPHQISGGEAQRVCIARCLLFHPRLLILDEATSMLDVSTQANVIGTVRRAMRLSGGSILLISHDRALVEAISDRIYEMHHLTLYPYSQEKEKNI